MEETNLKKKLQAAGVSMYAVAKKGGWSWQQVSEWCKGRRAPQLNTFKQLKNVLAQLGVKITIDDLQKIQ